MSSNPINASYASLVALQGLNQTTNDLTSVQNKVSTGLDVGAPQDNTSVWSIAQGQRTEINSLDSVKASLQRVQSTLDVTLSAGQSVSDLLNQIRAKTLSGADTSLNTTSRAAYANDVQSLISQISRIVSTASFNGANLITTAATAISALTDSNASTQTIQPRSLQIGGANITFTAGATFATATQANALLSLVTASITNTNSVVSAYGADSKAVTAHLDFVSTFQDTLSSNVGSLVDADLAKESAALTALQVKQQLGVQTLSIANSSRDTLLSLFK